MARTFRVSLVVVRSVVMVIRYYWSGSVNSNCLGDIGVIISCRFISFELLQLMNITAGKAEELS